MRPERCLLVFLFGLSSGCDNEVTVAKGESCFQSCLSVSTDLDIEGELTFSSDLRDSFEHARAGLVAYASVAEALTGFVQSMVELDPGMPVGLVYQGAGLYTAQPNMDTRVELRFYLPAPTSFGATNDRIDFNLFDVNNYFVSLGVKTSASVGLSGISTSVDFTFDGKGPGAELLGIASGARSPVAVDAKAFSKQLAKVIVLAHVIVAHESGAASIAFDLVPKSLPVGEVASATIPLPITKFVGSTSNTEQSLTLSAYDLTMQKAAAVYDGTIALSSVSPNFSFDMLFSYAASARADIVLGCPGATLELP